MAVGKKVMAGKGGNKKGEQLADYIWGLLFLEEVPCLPKDLKMGPQEEAICRELSEAREILKSYAGWDMEQAPEMRGALGGYLRALQSNFRHIIQRIQGALYANAPEGSGGRVSEPFSEMARRLERDLQAKETALLEKEAELRRTAERQAATIRAMQDREYRFLSQDSWDPLTGALTRNSFIRRAMAELEGAEVQGEKCCLAMLGPDRFKEFSGRYGHAAGEEALKRMVQAVSGVLRKTDFIGRYQETEFLVFFPNTRLEVCQMACERALTALVSAPVQLETGPAALTASIGLTQTAGAAGGRGYADFSTEWVIYQMMTQADRAAYRAKEGGCNRVVSYDGEREGEAVLDVRA
jgi:diguanylate cyclase (GGDEF)-like protein